MKTRQARPCSSPGRRALAGSEAQPPVAHASTRADRTVLLPDPLLWLSGVRKTGRAVQIQAKKARRARKRRHCCTGTPRETRRHLTTGRLRSASAGRRICGQPLLCSADLHARADSICCAATTRQIGIGSGPAPLIHDGAEHKGSWRRRGLSRAPET